MSSQATQPAVVLSTPPPATTASPVQPPATSPTSSSALTTAQQEKAALEKKVQELEAKQAARKAAKAAEFAAGGGGNALALPNSAGLKVSASTGSLATPSTTSPINKSPSAATLAPNTSAAANGGTTSPKATSTAVAARPTSSNPSSTTSSTTTPSSSNPTSPTNVATKSAPPQSHPHPSTTASPAAAKPTPNFQQPLQRTMTAAKPGHNKATPSMVIPKGTQLSSLGMLLGLKAPPPSTTSTLGAAPPAPLPPPSPLFTLLPPPAVALQFPSLPSLFTSRRSDGRRQAILIGAGNKGMAANLAAFRAQLGADESSDDEEEDGSGSDEDEEKAEKKKKEKEHKKHHKTAGGAGAHKTAQNVLTNGQKFPPDCTNKEERPAAGCGKPSIFHCNECKMNMCMDCDELVHVRPAKKNHTRVRVTRENAFGTQVVKVKMVTKNVKSLPATSLAGIKDQQMAQRSQEEKQNTSHPPTRVGGIGRIGLGPSSGGGLIESTTSSVPLNLPKTANMLQFISNEGLRNLPVPEVQKIFDFYCQSTPAGETKDKLRKDDLMKLSGDIIERLKRLLGEEMKKQGLSASQIPAGIEKEIEFIIKGKTLEEKKSTLILLLVNKAGSKSSSITKSQFIQIWGSLSAELFTVRTDGALGCIIC